MNEQKKSAASSAVGPDFVRGVIAEMRRVTWPSRQEWVSATILTIALVAVIGLYTFLIDQGLGWLFAQIHPTGV